jgi:hypothetical protein
MNMKQIAMIQQPRTSIWTIMRDFLPELAAGLEDIESVETISRSEDPLGVLTVENAWRARPNLPPAIAQHVSRDMLAWTDTAQWFGDRFETHWVITPQALSERLRCAGRTQYLEAMGGRGTRIAFDVNAELMPGATTGQFDESNPLFKALQSTVMTLLCKNFRRLIDHANEKIRRNGSGKIVSL